MRGKMKKITKLGLTLVFALAFAFMPLSVSAIYNEDAPNNIIETEDGYEDIVPLSEDAAPIGDDKSKESEDYDKSGLARDNVIGGTGENGFDWAWVAIGAGAVVIIIAVVLIVVKSKKK